MRFFRGVGITIGVFLAVGAIGSAFKDPPKPPTEAEKAAVLQRQQKEQAEAERNRQAIAADDAKKELRFNRTLLFAKAIQTNLRDPDSITWESISANDDATVICAAYRARNGFGGMNREFAVYAKGRASQEAATWNKHCVGKSLNDMMSVKFAL